MKTYYWSTILLSIAFIFGSSVSHGQRIQQDIFRDLSYKSDQYQAKLKKNIFGDLIFSDSNKNEITFNKAYLEKKMGPNYNDADTKSMFFQDLVMDYMQITGYEAAYKIDILGKLTITDNQGKKLTAKEDIFGQMHIKAENAAKSFDITTTSSGDLEYIPANQFAFLTQDSSGNKTYTDSYETKIVMAKNVWQRFLKKHQSENYAFIFLIEQFLVLDR